MIHSPNDRRDALPELAQVLLWCMRAWVIGVSRGVEVQRRIAGMFVALGVPDAAEYLDGFMWAVGQGTRRPVGINCVCHPELSADEHLLLQTLAMQQDRRSLRAVRELRGLLSLKAALVANDCATRLMASLNDAGHRLADEPAMPGAPAVTWELGAICPALPRVLH